MLGHQDEDDFDVSDDDSIINKLICERNEVRVRFDTIVIIENLPLANADLPNNLLSRLLIKNNCNVSYLTSSSGKEAGRHKGGRNKSTIDKIKHLLNDCGSPSQKILTIKAVLKDPIFCSENDHDDVIHMEK